MLTVFGVYKIKALANPNPNKKPRPTANHKKPWKVCKGYGKQLMNFKDRGCIRKTKAILNGRGITA